MRILLDTHVLLWWLADPQRLPDPARRILEKDGNDIYVSVASLWEVAIKSGKGRLRVDPAELLKGISVNHFSMLPIEAAHVLALLDLPPVHRDPFDRIIVAQADCESMRVLTHDAQLQSYGAAVLLV